MAKAKEDETGSKAVAVRQEAAVPAFMKQHAGMGVENLGMGDFEIPRIKLLQAISPEVTDGRGKSGQWWHTVLEEDLGPILDFVPLYLSKAAILWRPRHDGGGILARADDGMNWSPPNGKFTVKIDKRGTTRTWVMAPTVAESRLLEWGTYDVEDPMSQPAATRMLNVAIWIESLDSAAVLTFQRSSLSAGNKFAGKLKMSAAPTFGRRFRLSSVDDTNNTGDDFKNMSVEAVGFVEDEAKFKKYEEYYKLFKQLGLKIKDIEGLQDEAGNERRGDTEAPAAPAGAPRI